MQQVLEHQTVMLQEAVDAIVTDPGGFYVDGTFGRGGHSREILARLNASGRLLSLDRDPQAQEAAAAIVDARFAFNRAEFAQVAQLLKSQSVDGLLLDVGVSSPQIDDSARGFSFRFDGPLDMRMDPESGQSAAEFLASADQRQIAEVIKDYGEERFAVPIAKAIVARREGGQPVRTTGELSGLVAAAVKTREPGQNPATRTFQALRIHVNEELAQLQAALGAALNVLKPGGRIAVISFHSLEDRIVKQFMAKNARQEPDRRAPFAPVPEPVLNLLGRIKPSAAEVATNPRARSAVMRVAERTSAPFTPLSHSHDAHHARAAGFSKKRGRA